MSSRFNCYNVAWLLVMLGIAGYDLASYRFWSLSGAWSDIAIILVLSPFVFRRRYSTVVNNITVTSSSKESTDQVAAAIADRMKAQDKLRVLLNKGAEPVETPEHADPWTAGPSL